MKRILLICLGLVALSVSALAQVDTDQDNSFIVRLIEDQLSTESRQIRLSGVNGALSSSATIESITISDRNGVWLQIENAEIDWTRSALLGGRLEINRLAAQKVTIPRGPIAEPGKLTPEAKGFSIPDLPVAVTIADMSLAQVTFGEPLFGLAAIVQMSGNLELADGNASASLQATRLDGAGGNLTLSAAYENAAKTLNLDLALLEPEGGIVANLLKIEGRPAINLGLSGAGPLSDLDLTLALDAGAKRVLDGTLQLRGSDMGTHFATRVEGGVQSLFPAAFRPFFAGESMISAEGNLRAAGGFSIDAVQVKGAAVELEGSLNSEADGFVSALRLTGTIGSKDGTRTLLPIRGGSTSLQSGEIELDFGQGDDWTGNIAIRALAVGGITIPDTNIRFGGTTADLDDPLARKLTGFVDGRAEGISATSAEIAEALGKQIDIFIDTRWSAGTPVQVRQAQISGNGLSLFAGGSFQDWVFSGRMAANIASIAPLSDLFERNLSGAIRLSAEGTVNPLKSSFDLTLDGSSVDLAISEPVVDRLLLGETELEGRVSRTENGISTDSFRLGNTQVELRSTGQISSTQTDIGLDLRLADIGVIAPQTSGRAIFSAIAKGGSTPLKLELNLQIPEGFLVEKALRDARLSFSGSFPSQRRLVGQLTGAAMLEGKPVSIESYADYSGLQASVQDLQFRAQGVILDATLARTTDGLLSGTIALDAPDISTASAFFLSSASGSISGRMDLSRQANQQLLEVEGSIEEFLAQGARIGAAEFTARVENAFGVPRIDGNLNAERMVLSGLEIARLGAEARRVEGSSELSIDADLANGTRARLKGGFEPLEPGVLISMKEAVVSQSGFEAVLTEPAIVTFISGRLNLTPLNLDIGSGSLKVAGFVDDTIDLRFLLEDLPLAAINLVRDDLGLEGKASGEMRLSGERALPEAMFDLDVSELSSSLLRGSGLPPLSLTAQGQSQNSRLDLDASVSAPGGLKARLQGGAPLVQSAGELALDLEINAFPLVLLNRFADNQGMGGTAMGRANVTGPLDSPLVKFDLASRDLSARAMSQIGMRQITVTANGNYIDGRINLSDAVVSADGGLNLRLSGAIPLQGAGLDLRTDGTVPLSLVNLPLADRAIQASGTAVISASVAGSIQTPGYSGSFSVRDAVIVDPLSNIGVESITLDAALSGQRLEINRFEGKIAGGGQIRGGGNISLNPGRNYPADLSLTLANAFFSDGELISTRIDGRLSLNGALAGAAHLSGTLDFSRMEIIVPDSFGINETALLDVIHIGATPNMRMTLARAGLGPDTAEKEVSPSNITLDLTLNAPNQIFVRGRGIDAELGGSLRVTGRLDDPQPVGNFALRRGRLAILGKRLDFSEGSLVLLGNLRPRLRFVASAQSGEVSVQVTISGFADDPEIVFSSSPELPQDEIIARLIFDRGTDELSAFQLAQLAGAVASLGGKQGAGLVDEFRIGAGLENLDITTDADGGVGVAAGKYIRDNVYLDLEVEADGDRHATINLDITDTLKARGSVGTDGDSSLGLFFERDY